MELKLIEKRQETEDVFSFIFEPSTPVSWQAGQYALYKIPHDNPDDRRDTRIFTISSPPYQKNIMLTTRYLTQQSSSFTTALFAQEVGDSVDLQKVGGSFTIQNENHKMVFVAGGIGITPFHAILLELENQKTIKDIILIYSNKDEESIVLKDTLDRLEKRFKGFKVNYLFSPQRCDQELIKNVVQDIQDRIFYLSGPPGMVKAVEEALHQLKVNKENIREDYIPGTGE